MQPPPLSISMNRCRAWGDERGDRHRLEGAAASRPGRLERFRGRGGKGNRSGGDRSADPLRAEFEARGVSVRDGRWGYRVLMVEDLDGNELYFNYPNGPPEAGQA